jgi:hypothetical protein
MAKIKFGMMMTDARGKLGGQVFSKNRGGAYIRTKVTPSNPRTADQQANRALLGSLSQSWSGLTEAERASWNGAVSNWAKTNIFGDSHNPTGKNLFVQLNKNLSAAGFATILVAPEKVEMAILGLTSVEFNLTDDTLSLNNTGDTTGFTITLSATPSLTQGTSNAKNKFRNFYTAPSGDYDELDAYAAYAAKFGAPVIGANIQVSVKLVAENGQLSVPESVKATIIAP